MFFTALCGPIAAWADPSPRVIRRVYAPATVCGYSNKSGTSSGAFVPGAATAVAPCFITVGTEGENAGVSLAEIKVGGYTKIEDEGDGCEAGLKISMLNDGGALLSKKGLDGETHDVSYTWFDLGTDIPMGWYDDDYGLMADAETCEKLGQTQSYWGDAAEIFFKSGEGFRVEESSFFSGLYLTFSGEVRQGAVEAKGFLPGAAMSCGNPTPTEVPLSKMTVGGYTKIEDEGDGCEAGLKIIMLNDGGAMLSKKGLDGETHDVSYTWFDLATDIPAGWYDDDYGMMADTKTCEDLGQTQSYWGDAANIKFAPGDGFRVEESSFFTGLTLKFPSPLQAAE